MSVNSTNLQKLDGKLLLGPGGLIINGSQITSGNPEIVATASGANVTLAVTGGLLNITGSSSGAAAAGTLTGTTLNPTVVTSSLTSVGTLTSLNVNGLAQFKSYAKASLPSATAAGQVIYVSDATGAHKTGSLAFAIATGTGSWVDVTTGNFVA